MKKIILFTICITIYVLTPKNIYAAENEINTDQEKYGVNDFLTKSQEYTDSIDLKDFYNSSLSGKFDNNKFFKLLERLLTKNFKNAITGLSGVIIVVIIGSLLKSICENLGNESIF